jgi:hypothetical protein
LDDMSETATKPQLAVSELAEAMPLTAAWVRELRLKWGSEYVTGLIRRAMAGERNCFYAIEAGHFLGTPFDWEPKGQLLVSMSVLTGAKFVAAILDKDNTVRLQISAPSPEAAK